MGLLEEGKGVTFNPFWDLSCEYGFFSSASLISLSIPFGIYHYVDTLGYPALYFAFNPFWDLSAVKLIEDESYLDDIFQSLLGFIFLNFLCE